MPDTQMPLAAEPVAPQTSTAVPSVDQLQFQRAEAASGGPAGTCCLACKNPISGTYFQAAGHIVCPTCADRFQSGTQTPPASSLARAALFGGGAAIAGCAIYATVSIVTGMQIGLISILVGIMVGKAIRHASGGLGGRSQQVLAVALTYFAITTSYVPVFLYARASHPKAATQAQATPGQPAGRATRTPALDKMQSKLSPGTLALVLIALCAAAPFITLAHGSGFLTVLIIFFGLSQAWKLTARSKIRLVGPFQLTAG